MKLGILKDLPKIGNKNGWPWNVETDPSLYESIRCWPKISIVTPSYNQGEFLEETIRSVLLQNYPNLEYIIIDGRSTDNSVDIIKKYERWVNYRISEPDNGQSHAINKGILKCSGEIFNWLNSDDFYAPNALFHIASAFMVNDVDIVAGYQDRFIEKNGEYNTTSKVRLTYCKETERSLFFLEHRQPSTFFKFEKIQKLNGVRNDLNYVMDTDLFLRYLIRFGQDRINLIENVITRYRLQENSKTVTSEKMFKDEIVSIYSSLAEFAKNDLKCLHDNDTMPMQSYEISAVNPQKVLSYHAAFRALQTPRKNLFPYLFLIFKSIFLYPALNIEFIKFLFEQILCYKKSLSDFKIHELIDKTNYHHHLQ